MATTDSGQPTSSPQGAADWDKANEQGARDRQPAGQGGGGIAQLVRETTYQRLGSQKDRATDTLGSVAGAVRSVTDQLRDSGQPAIADYATRAADGIERWASQLRNQDIESTMRNVRQFARREPALFVGIAFGVGLLAARLLKSSSDGFQSEGGERFSSGGTNWDNPTSGGYGTRSPGNLGTGTSTGGLYGGGTPASGVGPTAGAFSPQPSDGAAASTIRDIPRMSSDIRPAGEVL